MPIRIFVDKAEDVEVIVNSAPLPVPSVEAPAVDVLNDTVAPVSMPIGQGPKGWKVSFQDDFTGPLLSKDGGKWEPLTSYGPSLRGYAAEHGQRQYWTWKGDKGGEVKPDPTGTVFDPFAERVVIDGRNYQGIKIGKTLAEDMIPFRRTWGMPYQAGMLSNHKTGAQTYGYYGAWFVVPDVKGTWPSFWLANDKTWPPEIDIFEFPNGPTNAPLPYGYEKAIHCNVWWQNGDADNRTASGGWVDAGTKVYDTPVYFSMLWTKQFIAFYVNGKRVMTKANPPESGKVKGLHIPQHVMIMQACGGQWAGPIEDAKMPCTMFVGEYRQFSPT